MQGKLNVRNAGLNMPITDPIFPAPPYHYRDCENIFVFFESDESLADFLPEELELFGDAPTGVFLMGHYGFSELGTYNEFVFFIMASYEGKPYLYAPKVYLDCDAPFAAGREIWGFAKKFANIKIAHQSDIVYATMDRPADTRLLTVQIKPSVNLRQEDYAGLPVLALKAIPKADYTGFDVLQLVEIPFTATPRLGTDGTAELWAGPASAFYGAESNDDPLHKAPIKNITQALYGRFDMYLPAGVVVKDYLAE